MIKATTLGSMLAAALCVVSVEAETSPLELPIDPSPDFRRMASWDYRSDADATESVFDVGFHRDTDNETKTLGVETNQPPAFGEVGSWRLNFGGWYSNNFESDQAFAGTAGVSYFLVRDLSIDLEIGLVGVEQSGPDAWGGNLNILLRWHFLSNPRWSLYADAGAGILGTSEDVPQRGSSFNFTPQIGTGVTFDVGRNWRAFAGIRWFHISNANTYDENPGRDSVQFYAGLSVPF